MADDFDAIADQLYALRPDDFATARDARVRELRAAGNAALARELAKLRRPTLSAWLVNLLWRDQHDVMEQLFQLSQELGRAQAQASGPALRELTAQRRQLETALLQRATALAREAGVNVTDSVTREAQETLSAALAEPEVADEVRSGRLVKPATYSGFGALPTTARPMPATPPPPSRAPIDITAAHRARERDQAERRLREARELLEAATRDVASATAAAERARQRERDLRTRLEELREQVRKAERDVDDAESGATAADHARERAAKARSDAQDAVARAEQALERLK